MNLPFYSIAYNSFISLCDVKKCARKHHRRIPVDHFHKTMTGSLCAGISSKTLRSGRRGFAVYREGKVVAQYTAMGRQE